MKTIFENNRVSVIGSNGDFKVTVKTSNGGALHSLAAEIDMLQQKVIELETLTQPTLECTSEPDVRHYHFYAEHKSESVSFDSVIEVKGFNADGFRMEIKKKVVEAYWKIKMNKSNPNDWCIKSLSRL